MPSGHYCRPPTRFQQDLNLYRINFQILLNEVVGLGCPLHHGVTLQWKSRSEKISKARWKKPLLKFYFNKVTVLQLATHLKDDCSVDTFLLKCNFIEIALRHGYSPVNLLHILRTPFYKNTSGELLLLMVRVL